MTSGESIKDLLLLYRNLELQYQLSEYTEEALKSIQRTLDIARSELFEEIAQRDIVVSKGREDMVLEELNSLTFGIQAELTRNIQEATVVAGEYSYQEYNNILSFNGKLVETVGFNFITVAPDQLRSMIINTPVGGRLLSEWISTSFETRIAENVEEAVKIGMLKGESVEATIKRVGSALGTARDRASIALDAENIVRTYIADINNTAAEAVYKANSDVIEKEKWNATFEVSTQSGHGTCLQCAGLHGKEFDIDGDHIRPPAHIRCRCFMIPVTKTFRELGLDIDEIKESLKPYTERDENRHILDTGRITDDFDAFLRSRDYQYQLNFFGENRLRMWNQGKIKVADLVDENGNLRLLEKEGGKYTGLAA